MEENKHFTIDWTNCRLCPRECGADRTRGFGACKVGNTITAARAALHMWEEPCISGDEGSGAVFFSGCNLGCVYCQNREIALGHSGRTITQDRLCEIYMELQEKKANNINLVTPGQYVPHIIEAVESARRQGLRIPIVYNTGSYEKVDTLKMLEGIVDIYLPDFKYMSRQLAKAYSKTEDYPKIARAAIAEMVRQQPKPLFQWENLTREEKAPVEAVEGAIMTKGVIVRQLLLPGSLSDAKKIISYLHETYGNQIYLSMMSQYTPLNEVPDFPKLNCRVSKHSYKKYIDYALDIGVENAFMQETDVAKESFIPDFGSGEGVLAPAKKE